MIINFLMRKLRLRKEVILSIIIVEVNRRDKIKPSLFAYQAQHYVTSNTNYSA